MRYVHGLAAAILAAGIFCASSVAHAATLSTIYAFCSQRNCADGIAPIGPLVRDEAGNAYGVTFEGGNTSGPLCQTISCGTIFEIPASAPKKHGAIKVLYRFCVDTDCSDGARPGAGLIIDVSGNLYGTTEAGGANIGGDVFMLSPDGRLHVLYSFCRKSKCKDGGSSFASAAALTYAGAAAGAPYDGVSPLYGPTEGGKNNCGAIFKLVPHAKKSVESLVHSFCSEPDGADGDGPEGVVADPAGDLYGTTDRGGANGQDSGVAFKIHGTSLTVLYSFCTLAGCADGQTPSGALALDAQGNLYGVTTKGGVNGGGVLYKLSLDGTYTKLYDFCGQTNCSDGMTPYTAPYVDSGGNLIGLTGKGGSTGHGTVYKMSGGTYQVLYNFCSRASCADGDNPDATLLPDGAGGFLGMTSQGGAGKFGQSGTVFEFTP